MKKFLLSLIVVIAFISYSAYQRIFSFQSKLPSKTIISPNLTLTPSPTSLSQQLTPTAMQQTAKSLYKDGKYTGDPADALYGNIQVEVTVANGRINNIQFLQFPSDRGTSLRINQEADPLLAKEAIQAQSAQVDIISGATDSSQAFIQSLQSALDKAKS